jgi:hypothetical protein
MTERQTPARPTDPRGADPSSAGGQAARGRAAAAERTPEPPTSQEQFTAALSGPDLEELTRRWHEIQAGFVDTPRQAVQDADALVVDIMNRVARILAAERDRLESRWSRGDEAGTEDLRVALQGYRALFQRLLSTR